MIDLARTTGAARAGRGGDRRRHARHPGAARALRQPAQGRAAVRRPQRGRRPLDRRLRRARARRPDAAQHAAVLATIAFVAALVLARRSRCSSSAASFPGSRISRAAVSRDSLKGLLGFSWFAFLGHIAGKVVFSADVIVIGIILGAKEVALYGVASRLFGLAAGVASTGNRAAAPVAERARGPRRARAPAGSLVTAGVRASAGVGVLLGFPLVILPVVGAHRLARVRLRASVVPLALLGAAATFTTTNASSSQYLFARGRPALLAIAQSASRPRTSALTIGLLLVTGDIWAAALATLVVEAISAHPRASLSGPTARRLVRDAMLARLGRAGARRDSSPPCRLSSSPAPSPTPSSLIVLAVVGAAWAVVFAAIAWRLALTDSERATIRWPRAQAATCPPAAPRMTP